MLMTMEITYQSRSSGELSSEEVKPKTLTEFFIEVNKGHSSSPDKATESSKQASEQKSTSSVEDQNMFVVNISDGHQHGEKLENVCNVFSEVDIHSENEQDEPKSAGIRRLFSFKPIKRNPEEIKESSSSQGTTVEPVSDENRAQSSPSAWPSLMKRANLTFERLRSGTPDSMISALQRFRSKTSKTSRNSSPDTPDSLKGNPELPPRSPDRDSRIMDALGSPTLGRLRALRKKLHTMGRQAGTRMERLQGTSSLSPSDRSRKKGSAGLRQSDSRQSRLHNSLERWRAELQRPPAWLREHFLRRRNRLSQELQQENTDQSQTQEPTSPVSQSPPQAPRSRHQVSQPPLSRRQQDKDMELQMVEQSMKMDEILRLPMKTYEPQFDKSNKICVVCTEDFNKGETLRVLTCFHSFHQGCIDEWLLNYCPWDNLICPICKTMQYSFLDPAFGNEAAQDRKKK